MLRMLDRFRMLFWLTKEEKAILKQLKQLKGLECTHYSFRVKGEDL